METGGFYYLKDKYFDVFPSEGLMKNKDSADGFLHDRPCFFAFTDKRTGLLWLIPISSKIEKYERIYKHKLKRSGKCDTIVFGEVLGHKKAFLIQNMCLATGDYIANQYIDLVTKKPVRIRHHTEKELVSKAKKVLALQRQGKNIIFPDVLTIEAELLKNL